MSLFEGGGFFSNTSNPRTNSNTSTMNNASYGAGSPVNINLAQVGGGKYSDVKVNPNITLSDFGAIAAAFEFASNANETASASGLQMAELARQAGQPVNALLENLGKNIFWIVGAVAAVGIVVAMKGR